MIFKLLEKQHDWTGVSKCHIKKSKSKPTLSVIEKCGSEGKAGEGTATEGETAKFLRIHCGAMMLFWCHLKARVCLFLPVPWLRYPLDCLSSQHFHKDQIHIRSGHNSTAVLVMNLSFINTPCHEIYKAISVVITVLINQVNYVKSLFGNIICINKSLEIEKSS